MDSERSENDEAMKAFELLGIDSEKLEHYAHLFSKWISSQKHLHQNYGEKFIKSFLIWSKLDMEKAKAKFLKFSYNSVVNSEFVSNRSIKREGDLKPLDYMYLAPMPKFTPDGYRVIVVKAFDVDLYEALTVCRWISIGADFVLHMQGMQAGDVIVIDMEHWKVQHYSKFLDFVMLKFLDLSQKNYPVRMKKVVVLNLAPSFVKGLNMCLSILPKKNKERTCILEKVEDIRKHISPECLPSDYGGSCVSIQQQSKEFWSKVEKKADFLTELGEIKPNGPIPKEIEVTSDVHGLNGSFRKLNID